MNNFKKIFLITFLFFSINLFFSNIIFASNFFDKINIEKYKNKEITREIAFRYIGENILKDNPKSYKYIKLEYTDIKTNTKLYESLQKLVFNDVIPNLDVKIDKQKNINALAFFQIIDNLLGSKYVNENNINSLKLRNVNLSDLIVIDNFIINLEKNDTSVDFQNNFINSFNNIEEQTKVKVFLDVYSTLLNEHYDSLKMDKNKILYGAIEGLTKGSEDKFTTFFPPSESKNFDESLSGEFEGIGAYVEMESPGILKIISPIAGSPAEGVGLKSGDIILKIDGNEITRTININQAVSLIKGPAGTKVKLIIFRDNKELEIEITRAKVTLKDVEYKIINDKFFYIQTRMFGDKVFEEFSASIDELKKHSKIKKIIIDLRNNPGGYLEQAVNILSLFIEKGKTTAFVKYKNGDLSYPSYGYNKIDLNEYEVYILSNPGTASASEIMIGTLKDYYPKIKIIGEKTYGKGSVQTIKSYYDGSSLKYTIAKWYTGLTQTGIDKIGINPDIEIKLDEEKFKTGGDNQLEYILKNY